MIEEFRTTATSWVLLLVLHGCGGSNETSGAGDDGGAMPASGGSLSGTGGSSGAAGSGGNAGSGGVGGSGGVAGSGGAAGSGAGGSDIFDASSATCSASATLTPGETTRTIDVGGTARTYILHVPASYTGDTPVPLVLDFHPLFGTGALERGNSGYLALSDQEGFIIAYPDGIDGAWNIGPCCTFSRDVDDLAFARAMVSEISAEGCIDSKRVYATGYSMGGGMSYHLACNAADVFAAVAPSAFDLLSDTEQPCAPSRPISVISFRGTADLSFPIPAAPRTRRTASPSPFIFSGRRALSTNGRPSTVVRARRQPAGTARAIRRAVRGSRSRCARHKTGDTSPAMRNSDGRRSNDIPCRERPRHSAIRELIMMRTGAPAQGAAVAILRQAAPARAVPVPTRGRFRPSRTSKRPALSAAPRSTTPVPETFTRSIRRSSWRRTARKTQSSRGRAAARRTTRATPFYRIWRRTASSS